MGRIKSEIEKYEEYLDWVKPEDVKTGIDAVAYEFNMSRSFVRPVVEDWFKRQSGETDVTGN